MAQAQYATVDDLKKFGIPKPAADFFGTSAMDSALQAASSIADSYLASQFVLPLTSWDASLRLQVCNIATYLLYNQFGFSNDKPGDELAKRRYTDALAWLEKVQESKIEPQFTDSSGVTSGEAAGAFVVSDAPVGFTDRGSTGPAPSLSPWDWWR